MIGPAMIPRALGLILILALSILGAPLAAEAQQPAKVVRIGFLNPSTPSATSHFLEAFRQGLRELGYVEGKSIILERRYAEGRVERLPDLAAELVRLKVDVILAGLNPTIQAVKRATTTIPIVMATSVDPVGAGLVASLARPGGNITGLSNLGHELSGKLLELLKGAVPRVSRVAFLGNPDVPHSTLAFRETQVAARVLGVELQLVEVRGKAEFESAFSAMTREHAGALIVHTPMALFFAHRKQIADLAVKNRLPAIYGNRDYVDAGGLMSYGAHLPDLYRRAATYVDKILKGAKPADLPVEQPTKFELVINLKTAKALGLTIPQSILIRADQVIQ